jgi:hypothetical protein
MIDVKQAIQKAKEFATDMLGQSDLLLEEVSSDDEAFEITLSMPRRAGTTEHALGNVAAATASGNPLSLLAKNYAANREFKEFRVLKSDGTVSKMSIRQLAWGVMAEIGPAILLDANLLLLVAVGTYDKSLIGRKRLDEYSTSDFDLLIDQISLFPRNLTTPHLLAEVSNLADQCIPKNWHAEFRIFLSEIIISQLDEHWTRATELCQTNEFRRLGLADAGVCQLANEETVVLSADVELYLVLLERGVDAQNFNHLREKWVIFARTWSIACWTDASPLQAAPPGHAGIGNHELGPPRLSHTFKSTVTVTESPKPNRLSVG